MRLHLTFSLITEGDPAVGIHREDWLTKVGRHCPMELQVHETSGRLLVLEDFREDFIVLMLECQITDPEGITLVPSRLFQRGIEECSEPMPIVDCPEMNLLELRAQEVAGALSLLQNLPIAYGTVMGGPGVENELIEESPSDEAILHRLEDPWVMPPIYGPATDSSLGHFELSGPLISQIAERRGIRGFWDAARAGTAVASFRELWRTLEQVFGLDGERLRAEVAASPAAVALGFDDAELYEYEVLRHRASHAAGKTHHAEAAEVRRLAFERVGRLNCLVEQILADGLVPFREDRASHNFNRMSWERPIRR